jgi:uncharacterized OB-fold protein
MSLMRSDPNAPPEWLGDLPVTNRYTYGLAGERFFRHIQNEGLIFGTRCAKCDLLYVPARAFCERCLSELEEWVNLGTRGEVHTFTLVQAGNAGEALETPVLAAVIRMGEQSQNPAGGLVHLLGEVAPEEVSIGMAVEAVFKPKDERQGSITDILYFKPVGAAEG